MMSSFRNVLCATSLLLLVVCPAAASDIAVALAPNCNAHVTEEGVTVQLPSPHGRDMAVVRPSGDYVFLSLDYLPEGGTENTPLSGPLFQTTSEYTVSLLGSGLVQKEDLTTELQPIFEGPGVYQLQVGSSLDSDAPNFNVLCDLIVSN